MAQGDFEEMPYNKILRPSNRRRIKGEWTMDRTLGGLNLKTPVKREIPKK